MIRRILSALLIPLVVAASLLRADAQVIPSAMYPVLVPPSGVVPHVDNTWLQVAWSEDLNIFAAVSNKSGSTAPVMTSANGTSWTLRIAPVGAGNSWSAIAWGHGAGMFCVVGDSKSMWSADGVTWTAASTPSPQGWYAVAWSESLGLFAAVGRNGDAITSPDCTTWTHQPTPTSRDYVSIAWSPTLNLFAAVINASAGTTAVTTSSDGVTWTDQTTDEVFGLQAIVWSSFLGQFVAMGTGVVSVTTALISSDGINWPATDAGSSFAATFKRNNLASSDSLTLLVYSILNTTAGADQMRSSPDGAVWTNNSLPASTSWWGTAWSPTLALFVCVNNVSGDLQAVMTSTNGTSWTLRTTP